MSAHFAPGATGYYGQHIFELPGQYPKRRAILLVAGDKAGTSQVKSYEVLIAKADRRFGQYLKGLKGR